MTGGYVYRGDHLPLVGQYLYGDWCTQRIWVAGNVGDGWSSVEWGSASNVINSLSSFGQDENCELYVVDRDHQDTPERGALFRIDDAERLFGAGFESRRCR